MFDIAIVGGGPAAATFAREMQGRGLSILLIDGQSTNRSKPCGGLLAPDAQKLLASFDFTLPKDILVDPQIFSVKTIDLCTKKIQYYPRCYLNMDRKKFDDFLLNKIKQDVVIVRGLCTKIRRMGDGCFELEVKSKQEKKTYSAKNIVGADGANSIVRKTFFPQKLPMQYVAIQQWFKFDGDRSPYYSCIFDPETSESCSWTIHKDNYLIYGGCFDRKDCRAMFELQKERFCNFFGIKLGEAVKTEACLVDRPRKMSDFLTGSEGIYLIGEAACFISPSSFEGISFAIKSGLDLAEAFREEEPSSVCRRYKKATFSMRLRLWMKMRKRWFMYTAPVRALIMKSGFSSVKVNKEN